MSNTVDLVVVGAFHGSEELARATLRMIVAKSLTPIIMDLSTPLGNSTEVGSNAS